MRAGRSIGVVTAAAGAVLAAAACPVWAQNEPVIVVPGRPGVPVMMYGIDVSGAVIEGEFGLNRPGMVAPTVIMPYWPHGVDPSAGGYFPATGRRPRYGRLEVIPPPNRRLPRPAEPFHRAWGIELAPLPATEPEPFASPPVIVAPRIGRARPRPATHPLPPRRP